VERNPIGREKEKIRARQARIFGLHLALALEVRCDRLKYGISTPAIAAPS